MVQVQKTALLFEKIRFETKFKAEDTLAAGADIWTTVNSHSNPERVKCEAPQTLTTHQMALSPSVRRVTEQVSGFTKAFLKRSLAHSLMQPSF